MITGPRKTWVRTPSNVRDRSLLSALSLSYRDQKSIGILGVTDTVRKTAQHAVENLTSLGVTRMGILSGDHEKSVARIASATGIQDTWAGLKPRDKLQVMDFMPPLHWESKAV